MIFHKDRAARHGRPKTIRRLGTNCDVCGAHSVCLGFDTSDEEYGDFWICEDCVHFAVTDGDGFRRVHASSRGQREGGDGGV